GTRRPRNSGSSPMPRARAHPGGNAEQGNRRNGRIRLRFARPDRFSVPAGAAISFFDFASAGYGGGVPGGVHAARFTGRRKAGEETVGQYENVQARIEEARISIQGERDTDYSHSCGRCCEGVRILEEAF